jgi:pyruvate kinase
MIDSSSAEKELEHVLRELAGLRSELVAAEHAHAQDIAARRACVRPSLVNLVHYMAMRRRDLRSLQTELARHGLSSLGRAEANVLATLDAVLRAVAALSGRPVALEPSLDAPGFDDAHALLEARTAELLGPRPHGRAAHVMVTLPSEAASDEAFLRELLAAGTTLVRINTAHDDERVWRAMVASVRRVSAELGRPCRIEVDLAGPKLRTGPAVQPIVLRSGSRVRLASSEPSERPHAERPAWIGCTLPGVLARVHAGETVAFDDGKIGGVVEHSDELGVLVRITLARATGSELKPDRSINFPDSDLDLHCVTPADRRALPFVVENADLLGLSFVERASDLAELEAELASMRAEHLGLVLKIETKRGFAQLPSLLFRSIGRRPVGIMIARGDLAVECGYERLAEVQEEMLWVCEAAHVPVIWATQVLERLAKKGLPTRAEITDAAMSERAECVMLNKGPHIIAAVKLLSDILHRMEAHQGKKRAALRPLSISACPL